MGDQKSLACVLATFLVISLAGAHDSTIAHDWEEINRMEGVDRKLYQGDIMLTREQKAFLSSRKGMNFATFPSNKWPDVNGYPLVPYRLDSSLTNDSLTAINQAINHWMQSTCIVFQATSNASQAHLLFTKLSGCWSYIGKVSTTGQNVSIGAGCEKLGIAAHEIGHAMGFYHEQSRDDRDDYVIINFNNIQSAYTNNFNKAQSYELNNFSVPYDFSSDMHYGSTYFTSNGKLTIITKDPLNQGLIGKRVGLSHRDKRLANLMYGCISKWLANCGVASDPCQNEGYFGPNCTCVCRPGTTGTNCESITADYYAAIRPTCNQVISSPGIITNPGYPTMYTYGVECSYLLQAPVGCKVQITFLAFQLYNSTTYCQYDILEIRLNGTYYGDVYCGTQIAVGQVFTSVSNEAVLYFSTRAYGNGWKANVTFDCSSATTVAPTTSTVSTTTTTTPTTTKTSTASTTTVATTKAATTTTTKPTTTTTKATTTTRRTTTTTTRRTTTTTTRRTTTTTTRRTTTTTRRPTTTTTRRTTTTTTRRTTTKSPTTLPLGR